MSYLVLARKWRPKNFSETVGQEHVLRALTNALDGERLHHAYLFTGTRGVGKTTIARILAKALNCEQGPTSSPCGECGACREIDEGRFVDLIEVDAASKTKVDDTRDLLDNVQFAPAHGRYKVYLIDEVHMLTKHSFNALLKTLEEPPPHVKFLLATTDPQKLPVTVLSRCLQFNLKRLTPNLIRERLAYICEQEQISADPAALALVARAADGSLRDALSLLDQAIAYCGGELTEEPVAAMLGTVNREHVSRLLELLAEGDAAGLLQEIAVIDEQFPDYGQLLDDLARSLQKLAVFQAVGSCEPEDEFAESELARLADSLTPEDLQLFYQTAIIGRRDLALAPDPRSGIEMTLLRMLAFRPLVPGEASGTPAGGAARPAPAKAAPANKGESARNGQAPAAAPAGDKAAATDWSDPDWTELVGQLDLSGAARLVAINCGFLRREGNVVHLALDARSETLLTGARRQALADALSARFGEPLRVDIEIGGAEVDTPVRAEARREDEALEAARESLESDPNVRALKDMFGATLRADSVKVIDK